MIDLFNEMLAEPCGRWLLAIAVTPPVCLIITVIIKYVL